VYVEAQGGTKTIECVGALVAQPSHLSEKSTYEKSVEIDGLSTSAESTTPPLGVGQKQCRDHQMTMPWS
jgi:hypothetical protein